MSVVRIVAAQADKAGVRDLLKESHALMASLFPSELQRKFSIGPLCSPNTRVFAAHVWQEAIDELKTVVRLETGKLLLEAHQLYERHGYIRRTVFGCTHGFPGKLFHGKESNTANLNAL
jgi:hypothetical protein